MTQPTLDGTPPAETRIWPRYRDSDAINHAAWLRAHAESQFVGMCQCGGYLRPQQPDEHDGRTDYIAVCTACQHDVVAPGGRTQRPYTGRR